MTAVCLRRWFRSPPVCSFSSRFKPEVFLCPGKEAPSVAGCCSLQLEQDNGADQRCRMDSNPTVFHTSSEKVLGVGSKQPLRYCSCSQLFL